MESLWPEEIKTPVTMKSPYSILKEQGQLLGGRTNNIVIGRVQRMETSGNFTYKFHIRSDILNYSYELFRLQYDIKLYPLQLFSDDEDVTKGIGIEKGGINIENENEFKSYLKKIFSTDKVKKIISALISQSEDVEA